MLGPLSVSLIFSIQMAGKGREGLFAQEFLGARPSPTLHWLPYTVILSHFIGQNWSHGPTYLAEETGKCSLAVCPGSGEEHGYWSEHG